MLLCSWDFPGTNTAVGCHALFQRIFLTQGLNLCLLCLMHWQAGSLPLLPHGELFLHVTYNQYCFQFCSSAYFPLFPPWGKHWFVVVVVQLLSRVQHFVTPLSFTISQSLLKLLCLVLLNLWLCGSQQTGKFFKRWEYQFTLPASWETSMQVKKQQLKLNME